jgi:hypothetical protein
VQITVLHLLAVQWDKVCSAAAFDGGGVGSGHAQIMFERSQQERAKPAFLGGNRGEIIFGHKPVKEFLGQILGRMRVITLATNEGIERIIISGAEKFESGMGCRSVGLLRIEHDTPMRRGEAAGPRFR